MNHRISLNLISTGLGICLLLLVLAALFLNDGQLQYAQKQMDSFLERIHFEREAENNGLENALWTAAEWTSNIDKDSIDLTSLNEQFHPLVSHTSQLSALSIVWPSGESYLIRFESPHHESFFSKDELLGQKEVIVWPEGSGEGVWVDSLIAYPVQAEQDFAERWTQTPDTVLSYPLMDIPGPSNFPGASYTLRIRHASGEYLLVTAYRSLQLSARFNRSIQITDSSDIVLFTNGGRFFNDTSLQTEGFLIPWEEARGSLLHTALSTWAEKQVGRQTLILSFKHLGKRYYAAYEPIQESPNGIWTALIMPEADFGFFASGKLYYVIAFILLLISGLLLLIRRMILRKERQTILFGEEEADIQALVARGEGDQMEFKSTVRLNLHTQKMGKEIELAWLKSVVGFCNTHGGVILIGVSDDGGITGLGPDRFPNDDKALLHVQNLIKQHVGLQFAKYIHYSIHNADQEKVLMVRCLPCKQPVFLVNGEKEQYYVRSGPASIELGISKALRYIQDRSR